MPWAKMCMKLDTVNLDDVILNPQKNQDHKPASQAKFKCACIYTVECINNIQGIVSESQLGKSSF